MKSEFSLSAYEEKDKIALQQIEEGSLEISSNPFPSCGYLGLYPVIPSLEWLESLMQWGVQHIQLRVKDVRDHALSMMIKKGIESAVKAGVKLWINDHWEFALEHGAYGVHLGQEDLHDADVEALRKAGIRLGLSTHCPFEIVRAYGLQPSYLALGPIFPTTSHSTPFPPQGISALKEWQHRLPYTWVAIGGIQENNIEAVAQTGVQGIALISAITKASHPKIATENLLKKMVI